MIGNSGLARLAVVSVTLVALSSVNAAAQEPPSGAAPASGPARPGTPEFGRMVFGRKVTVTTADGQRHKGSFTPSGIFAGPGTPVPSDQIVKVERVTHSVGKGLAIGLIPGIAVGFLTLKVSCDDECNMAGLWVPVLVGAGVGAGIGAAHRKSEVLYDAKRRPTRTMSIAPILSKTRKGAMLSMTWR